MSIVIRFDRCAGLIPAAGRSMAACLAVLGLWACEDLHYPRDPGGTLDRVLATGRMQVAAVDHVPWVVIEDDGVPRGAEAELVESFARELGVAVDWRRASAFTALEALKRGDADIAIGGFTEKNVTAQGRAGHTYAYFAQALVVAADPGAPVPQELDGLRVHVDPHLLADGLVRDAGGLPFAEKNAEVRLAALPDWELPARDLVPTEVTLYRNEHVIAVPQGENAWLMRLELFLRQNAGDMGAKLRAHSP